MEVDFERQADVVVAGAGVAGVAAALEVARRGLHAVLVEKSLLAGGLATAGLVNIYLPLCDGNGTQVTFGLAEELLHLSIRYGPGDVPPGWRDGRDAPERERYRVAFSPAAFALALDQVLEAEGVELWLDTLVTAPVVESGRLTGLAVENKSGRGLLRARCVVDATGDADVAHRAGAPCAQGPNWLALWAIQASLERAQQAAARGSAEPLLDVVRLGGDNAGRGATGAPGWRGAEGRGVTRFALESRRLLREHLAARQAALGPRGRHELFPLALPTQAQFRTTRRIAGAATLSDGGAGRHAADSVGLAADWRRAGSVWEIPYGTLLPRGVGGLLAAGRCISSEGDAWEITRVIPAAALTGQAAGVAAALSVQGATSPERLDAADVQRELAGRGVPLHLGDVGL